MRIELREIELTLLKSAFDTYSNIDYVKLDGVLTIWVISQGHKYSGSYVSNHVIWTEISTINV